MNIMGGVSRETLAAISLRHNTIRHYSSGFLWTQLNLLTARMFLLRNVVRTKYNPEHAIKQE